MRLQAVGAEKMAGSALKYVVIREAEADAAIVDASVGSARHLRPHCEFTVMGPYL